MSFPTKHVLVVCLLLLLLSGCDPGGQATTSPTPLPRTTCVGDECDQYLPQAMQHCGDQFARLVEDIAVKDSHHTIVVHLQLYESKQAGCRNVQWASLLVSSANLQTFTIVTVRDVSGDEPTQDGSVTYQPPFSPGANYDGRLLGFDFDPADHKQYLNDCFGSAFSGIDVYNVSIQEYGYVHCPAP